MVFDSSRMIKFDGCDLYIFEDFIYISESNYSHFYKLEDAFKFYSEAKKLISKDIIFCFKEFEFYINNETTYEDILNQLKRQNIDENSILIKDISDKYIKEDRREFYEYYLKYLRENNDSLYKLFYKSNLKMPKSLKKSEK